MTSDTKRQLRDLLSANLLRVQLRKVGDTPRRAFIDMLAKDIKVVDALQKMFLGIVGVCPVSENDFKSDPQMGDFKYIMDNWNKANDQQKGSITNFFYTLFDSTAFKKLGSRSRIELDLRRKFALGPKKPFIEPMPTQGGQAYFTQVTPSEAPIAQHTEIAGNAVIPSNLDPRGGKGDLVPDTVHPDALMMNQALPIPISIQNAATDISSYQPSMYQRSSTVVVPDSAITGTSKMEIDPQTTYQPDPSSKILGKRKGMDDVVISRSKLQRMEDGLHDINMDRTKDSSGIVDMSALNPTVFQQTQQSANSTTPGGTPGIITDGKNEFISGTKQPTLEEKKSAGIVETVQNIKDNVENITGNIDKTLDNVRNTAQKGVQTVSWLQQIFGAVSPDQRELLSTDEETYDPDAIMTVPKKEITTTEQRKNHNRKLLGDKLSDLNIRTMGLSPEVFTMTAGTALARLIGLAGEERISPPDFRDGIFYPLYQMLQGSYGLSGMAHTNRAIKLNFAAIKSRVYLNAADEATWRELARFANTQDTFASRIFSLLNPLVDEIWNIQNSDDDQESTQHRYTELIVELSYLAHTLRTEYLTAARISGQSVQYYSPPPIQVSGSSIDAFNDVKYTLFNSEEYKQNIRRRFIQAQIPISAARNVYGSLFRLYTPFDAEAQGTENIPWIAPEQFIASKLMEYKQSDETNRAFVEIYQEQFNRLMQKAIEEAGTFSIQNYEIEPYLRYSHYRGKSLEDINKFIKNAKELNTYKQFETAVKTPYNLETDYKWPLVDEPLKVLLKKKQQLKLGQLSDMPTAQEIEKEIFDWEKEHQMVASSVGSYPETTQLTPQPVVQNLGDQSVAQQDGRMMRGGGGMKVNYEDKYAGPGKPTPTPSPSPTPVPTAATIVNLPEDDEDEKKDHKGFDKEIQRVATQYGKDVHDITGMVQAIVNGLANEYLQRLRIQKLEGRGISMPTRVLDFIIRNYRLLRGLEGHQSRIIDQYLQGIEASIDKEPIILVPRWMPTESPTASPENPTPTPTEPAVAKPMPKPIPENKQTKEKPEVPTPAPTPQPSPPPTGTPAPTKKTQDQRTQALTETGKSDTQKNLNYDPVLTPVQVPTNTQDLPNTNITSTLNPLFLVNGDKVISEMHDDPMNKIINTLSWESFVLANQEPNQEADNPLNMLNFIEEVNRFSGELEGDNWFPQQCKDAIQEEANEMSELIENIPEEFKTEGQAVVIDTISGPQHAMPANQTDSLFHDVFLPCWMQIPKSSPWQQFTQPEGSQIPDSMIEDNGRWAGNDWPLLATENRFIYNVDS